MQVNLGTHWLRKANRYLMMMRVLLGRDCSTFLMWTARSWRLSMAEAKRSHDTQDITHTKREHTLCFCTAQIKG